MYIMTKDGYRPLVSFKHVWDARLARLNEAKLVVVEAQHIEARTDQERAYKNATLNRAYAALSAAQDAMIGG